MGYGWTWSPPRRPLPPDEGSGQKLYWSRILAGMREMCSGLSIVSTFRQSVGHCVGKAGFHLYYWPNERRPHMTRTLRKDSHGPFAALRVAITGGTSGLGLALSRELLGRGAHLAFVARNRERVERIARE